MAERITKTQVKKVGERIAKDCQLDSDWAIFEEWRSYHVDFMNALQISLRRRIKNHGGSKIYLAQRLKRKNTIIDKLKTGRAKDLSTMHDLAGFRLIFKDIHELNDFRKKLQLASFKRKNISNKYDYIKSPKNTGYRGIHDVYTYNDNGKSKSKEFYKDLSIEIQYRTKVQHAWATAVELYDLISDSKIKFEKSANEKTQKVERFFILASEYLARKKENHNGCEKKLSDEEILKELNSLDEELQIISTLNLLNESKTPEIPSKDKNKEHVVLRWHKKLTVLDQVLKVLSEARSGGQVDRFKTTTVTCFSTENEALEYVRKLEADFPEDNVVYVSGKKPADIKVAFTNYYSDSEHFVQLLKPAFL